MVGLHGMSATSSLLQQLSGREASALTPQDAVFSSAPVLDSEFRAGVSVEKAVGSAAFNALASLSEKRADTLDDALQHIDQAGVGAMLVPSAGKPIEGALDQQTQLAAKLRQYVLDHPGIVHDMLEDIKAGRPSLSKQQAMSLLMGKLGEMLSAASSAQASAS